MSPSAPYKIVTNSRQRRILVINKMMNPEMIDRIEDEEFDAIYINVANRTYEETRLVSRWLSPTREGKSFLKPRFGNSDMKNYMRQMSEFFDGLCDTPLDENFANKIEEIYQNIDKYGINRELHSDISTTSRLLANLVKYDITRGRLTFTNHAIRGIAQGFSNRYLMMYDNMEALQLEERLKFVQKLEELGYAEKTRLVDRIHICKECGDSHQLFIECCPVCKSSDIHQESMIHHFRCANISAESTYFKEGALVCPKCKRTLRHIGVDYDRPANVFSCTCGNTFMHSDMKVVCTNCMHEGTPDELTPIDVYEYKLTPTGIAAFASDEAIFQLESTDIYSGRSTFENFCESIRIFHTLPTYDNQSILVFRYHYIYNGNQEDAQVFDVMRNIMMHNATVKLSTNDNNFYVMLVAPTSKIDDEYKYAKTNLDRIFEELSEENDDFDAKWLTTYSFTRDQDPEYFIKEITKKIEDATLENLHENANA